MIQELKWALHFNILSIKNTWSKSHYCLSEKKEDVMDKNKRRRAGWYKTEEKFSLQGESEAVKVVFDILMGLNEHILCIFHHSPCKNTMVLQNVIFRWRMSIWQCRFIVKDKWIRNNKYYYHSRNVTGICIWANDGILFTHLFLFLWKNFQPPLHSPSYI